MVEEDIILELFQSMAFYHKETVTLFGKAIAGGDLQVTMPDMASCECQAN